MKNYYEELGVAEDASEDDIKKAYRKLAMAYHPDRTQGDKKKEERFKLINVAYETLSHPQKKKEYDAQQAYQNNAYAHSGNGFNNFGGQSASDTDMDSMFRSFFNQGSGGFSPFGDSGFSQPQGPQRKVLQVNLTFWESVIGVKKTFNTTFTYSSGKKAQEEFEVNIPAGAESGDVYNVQTKNGQHFSLVVEAPTKSEDGLYRRDGNNLHTYVEVPITVAIHGGKFTYSHWDSDLELKIPSGAQSGQMLRLKSKGVKGEPRFGDLFIELRVKTPTKLTAEQKELFEKLAATFEKKDYFEPLSNSWKNKNK